MPLAADDAVQAGGLGEAPYRTPALPRVVRMSAFQLGSISASTRFWLGVMMTGNS